MVLEQFLVASQAPWKPCSLGILPTALQIMNPALAYEALGVASLRDAAPDISLRGPALSCMSLNDP